MKYDLVRNYFVLQCVLIQIADTNRVEYSWLERQLSLTSFIERINASYIRGRCAIPNQAIDQSYGWNCHNGVSSVLNISPGQLSEIKSICNPGYTRENANYLFVSYCSNNQWSPPVPECKRICKRLFPSEDLIVKCYKDDEEINCHQPLLSGTEVRATCKPYRRQIDTQSENRIVCENGQWNGTLPECVLEHGKIDGDDFSRMVFGDTYNYNRFPWHVAIYDVSSTPVLICSGSIISTYLIITATDCIKDLQTNRSLDVKYFEIIVGKVTPDYFFQDNEFQKSYKVRKIHKGDTHDVAILEVVEEMLFSYGVSPIDLISEMGLWKMLVVNNTTHQEIPGRVPSWGIMDLDKVHEADFRIDEYITKAFGHCTNEENKFCGQQTYGAGTNIGDMGAGFIYYKQEEQRYYLIGVVNKKYRFQNNFVVICSDLKDTDTWIWMDRISQRAMNQRVIDNAALNFKTRPECEYERAFDVNLQKASVCLRPQKNNLILPCKRTCDKLLQPQGMLLTCTYNNIEIECDQELTSGVKVSFRCFDGYKPKHQINYQSIECQENGKWSNQLFPCIRDDIKSCALPPVTEDKVYIIDCDPNRKCAQCEEYVKELTMLAFQCNPGYYYQELAPKNKHFFCDPDIYYKEKLNNFQVICLNGSWTPKIGNCSKLCKVFTSINLKPECYFNNKTISCNQPLFAGTRMRPLCQKYYRKKYKVKFEELTCNENGEWDGFPIECIPYYSTNERDDFGDDNHEILYHVSIIEKEIKSPICAGTLISPYLVLTAARCFYNPMTKRLGDANQYEIIVGHMIRRLSSSLNKDVLKFIHHKKAYQVKIIYNTNKGRTKVTANYSEDLAVLETIQKIELNVNTIPACVNWRQSDEFDITQYYTFADNEAAQPGRIAKWGTDYFEDDGTYIGSEIFPATYFPLKYTHCQQYTRNTKMINNSDLFCVYISDMHVKDLISKNHRLETSDYGAGYVQIRGDNKEYYVQGVFSLISTNESFYQVISTNYHAKWLNKIRLHVEKRRTFEESRKSFDVDSFHRKDDCQDGLPYLEFDSDPKLRISCNGSSINRDFSKGCNLPQRKLHNIEGKHVCNTKVYDNYCQGVGENGSVPQLTKFSYHCLEGYAVPLSGSVNHWVSFCDEDWSPSIFTCKKYCMKLRPTNVKLTCYYNEAPVSCKGNLVQDTIVVPECIREYEPESDPSYKEITCLSNGQWSDPLYRCRPKCGRSASNVTTLIRGGDEARFGEFPWHVAIYDKTTNNTLICGGSIISPYVVVSAAHCFYDEQRSAIRPASNYVIAVGKISRDINKRDSGVTVFYEIEKIILENFLGRTLRYQFDIAILQIKDEIIFSAQVIPVCLRQSETTIISSGEMLYVSGWGVDRSERPSSILRVATMPYLSISECSKKAPDHLLGFISTDKFCVENINGSIVDSGDSGGGLSCVDKVSSLHYLVGIVSYRAADLPMVAIITDITQDMYMRWISKQMNEIHRAKQYDI